MEYIDNVPRSKKKYIESCSVNGCGSNTLENLSLCFHNFPKPGQVVHVENYFGQLEKVDKLQAWQRVLKIKNINSKKKVCSLHFKKEDYILPDFPSKKRKLKTTAVPSLNLPIAVKNNKINNDRLKRRESRRKNQETSSTIKDIDASMITESFATNETSEIPEDLAASLEKVEMTKNIESTTPLYIDVGVQVQSDNFSYNLTHYIKTERDLSTAIGINSFQLLDTIIEMVKIAFGDKLENNCVKMSLRDRIIMTYMKLKQNISYSFLALLFNCYSSTHCRRVFYEMINILSETLKVALTWPSREEISKNIPKCFEGFENVRVVIDCTEIFIQEPKNLCCQILTHSSYKKARTGKIMTGVAPDGSITYLSKVWGGRASDTTIFEHSDIIGLLEPDDAVMADKGFLIDEVCAKNRWKLIRPPFVKNKKQLSAMESIITAKIAKARVHVERSNQRIKTFKILGGTMPVQLVPYLEDIFIIICATINLTSPILKDDKFVKQ